MLVDSSFLYSAFTYSGITDRRLEKLIRSHEMVITDYIMEEVKRNIRNKLSGDDLVVANENFDNFCNNCRIIYNSEYNQNLDIALSLVNNKDSPIMACAMLECVDALLTSDKELWEVSHPDLVVLRPKDFELE